ncbi:lipocalin family protein [Sediminitomix flava]|uniref:Lipocalin-like domain-containing protein n=1 Tax=Sediminitomix flava TaxID=379075 RepID=A0A315Z7N4_SEDFL|nr:lipocalin family protein [Sediminitomix flava]PWJ40051.1 hypothetical protein BC781_105114 [Sediminitomix flava]
MKYTITFFLIATLIAACQPQNTQEEVLESKVPLVGTWKLISATTIKDDTVVVDSLKGKAMYKIINDSHFSFTNYSTSEQQERYISGGGKYELSGNQYTEHLDFCNFGWEGRSFTFNIQISNDTLIQQGKEEIADLGVSHDIIEKYIRVE